MLLLVFLLACGYNGTTGNSGTPGQTSKTLPGSCPQEETKTSAVTDTVVYAVSWDAVAKDADNNQGVSALHVSAVDTSNGKLLWQKAPANVSTLIA